MKNQGLGLWLFLPSARFRMLVSAIQSFRFPAVGLDVTLNFGLCSCLDADLITFRCRRSSNNACNLAH